ncbi:DeoR/GlpR family DNA-binding transcription regulator [Arthrobacter sp. RAF14]|uniref:DeoR/GlpR family DNA-binding transcription regulator n=1 Tax=Arthrobacter sp. RAF14 TaxID=3233051 RepID=UPI003F923413
MYPVERHRWIIETARAQGRLEVPEIAGQLGVAVETVRRDLNVLERRGLIRRVHGGAIPVEKLGFESTLLARGSSHPEAKARIAQAALEYTDDVESIFIDEGSTAAAYAAQLRPNRPVLVVTSSLPVASQLAVRPHLDVVILGGRVRPNTLGAVDHWATDMLSRLVLDLAVVGTNGATGKHGLTCPDSSVAAVKSAAVRASRRTLLIADESKFGVDSSIKFADLHDLDAVVTEKTVPESHLQPFRRLGVQITQV